MERVGYKDLAYPPYLPDELKGKKDFWIGSNDPFSILLVVEGPSVGIVREALQSGQGLFINFKVRSAEMDELDYYDEELCHVFIDKIYQGQHGDIHFLAQANFGISMSRFLDTIWVWDYDGFDEAGADVLIGD